MYTYTKVDDEKFPYRCNVGGYVFETEIRAKNFCQMWNDHFDALRAIENVPSILSRKEYEAECSKLSIIPLPDSECDSYGVKYGEFEPWLDDDKIAGYEPGYCVAMALAGKRLSGIKKEKSEIVKPVAKPVEYVMCDSGHETPRNLRMSASLGTSCPDCYDRMSD